MILKRKKKKKKAVAVKVAHAAYKNSSVYTKKRCISCFTKLFYYHPRLVDLERPEVNTKRVSIRRGLGSWFVLRLASLCFSNITLVTSNLNDSGPRVQDLLSSTTAPREQSRDKSYSDFLRDDWTKYRSV